MKNSTRIIATVVAATLLANLTACSSTPVSKQAKKMQTGAEYAIQEANDKAPQSAPVITNTSGAWLMGQTIKVAAPVSPILGTQITYHPAQRVSLSDIASFVALETHLLIDVSEVQSSNSSGSSAGGTPGLPGGMPPMPTGMLGMSGANAPQTLQSMSISYEGSVSGLFDIVANKGAIWWKFVDGKVIFYRTETKTFYLPANSRKSLGNSTIATNAGGSSGGTGTTGGTSSNSGASISSDYAVDIWGDMANTAKTVGSGAQVAVNPSAGSLTVTGTPSQVRAVEDWVKGLTEQLSQQVAITVHMYRVKVTAEDTYNFDPTIVFKKAAGVYGFNLTPTSPLIPLSGQTPVGVGVSILTGAPGASAQYSGTQAAFQALSTLGSVSETLQQTIVTLNGQPAPIQSANQQGYLASSTVTQTANVGSNITQTSGTVTTGFTATFLPRVVNGRIILNMTMTNSSLISITTVGGAASPIQSPNVDLNTFQQSVSLTPGDALLLTGLQQDKSKNNNSGIGSPTNALFGGGVNANTDKFMIAIVISAKVL